MTNIFKKQQEINEHPNRNNFDLSFKSNLSMKFGTLYPVFCKPVVPGDSFSIDTAFNLKLQPVVFPVQTKMRAHMHYFYVRNKNLWENWENWISNLVSNSEHPHPYISLSDDKFKSGSIHDFLGVPTSALTSSNLNVRSRYIPPSYGRPTVQALYAPMISIGDSVSDIDFSTSVGEEAINVSYPFVFSVFPETTSKLSFSFNYPSEYTRQSFEQFFSVGTVNFLIFVGETFSTSVYKEFLSRTTHFVFNEDGTISFTAAGITRLNAYSADKPIYLILNRKFDNGVSSEVSEVTPQAIYHETSGLTYVVSNAASFVDYSDMQIPLYSQNLHINALPYRAYESIYYAYYNNTVLNPLKIGGQVQYNRYNTNLGDGADTTDYHLFQRNYELDFLTSALPSPQQGVAPLVGMTALGDITIEDENGITTAHADIDNDGTISKVVVTSPAASVEHARTAMNIAACGMSINDFRASNSLQRFLETSIRKGYKYIDFIAGHFGKSPEYRVLDLPEFIGGFSRDVSVSTVVSNADTLSEGSPYGAALGQYGGYAQVVGGSKSSIRHYCDDYGYIVGILCVVPTPCYSQLLRKDMICPNNFLDYYFPEFNNIGMQPITYKEVAPIQSYIDSLSDPSKSLEDTFGYQRPNYDLVSSVDELHGDFRGSLKDWVINRIFDTRPELGQSFISINPAEINDIFVDTNSDDDTILGEIGFSVHAKRPIPRVVIPNLGK